ncbi:hypothetical protein K3495_g6162 [Podosphaera aphanis]|nr:hypothetical protein K3495_g6162 [Podosphaera aphanis]
MVIEEAALKTGITPISARALATSKERPAIDWIIHFPTGNSKLGERPTIIISPATKDLPMQLLLGQPPNASMLKRRKMQEVWFPGTQI